MSDIVSSYLKYNFYWISPFKKKNKKIIKQKKKENMEKIDQSKIN